ncbi:Calx-beta domain-containing protein [Crocosphaera sp.]|uniref:Calx-beta domain-containing protein n=1 Tax=Crocosphaera sp. TaxID=2729996 RepID=UPI003F290ABE|nr:Calx-beta domain-containing protein [Crocosphaera sp.]
MNNYQTIIEFSAANYSVLETEQPLLNPIEITVTRSGNIDQYNSIEIALGNGTAEAGSDFEATFPRSVAFEPGQTEKKVYIDIYDDFELEGTENFELKLIADLLDPSLILGQQNITTVSILDNETTDLQFELATAENTPATVESSPVVEFASTTYRINEDQGSSLVVSLTRSGDTSVNSLVHLDAMGGTATLGSDYTFNDLIEFAVGETSKTVEILLSNDGQIEGTETIELQILSSQLNDNYVIGTQNTTTVEILDNSPTVEFGSATYSIGEDQGLSMAVTLTRSGDTSFDSLVRINPMGGTATLGLDYGFNNAIYFAAGETSKSVDIFLNNDGQVEGTETIELQLASGQGNDNYLVGSQNTTTVEIVETVEEVVDVATNNNVTIAEIGEITNLTHESQTIVLDHNFTNPVIFAQPLSYNGPDPSTIRITDIQSDRFSVQVQETSLINGQTHNGSHTTESFSFLVVEQGVWELSDGSILEVGNITTDAITTSNWETINFNQDFSDTPVVLTQVQTDNDATFVRTRQNNTTHTGFQVALEEEEAYKSSGHGSETIAWLAMSPGQGNWDGNEFIAGNTGDQVTHHWHTLDFGNTFLNAPKFLGNIATFDGADPSGLRYQNLTNGNVQIMVEEDNSYDSEIQHTTEDINFLAIEADGNLTGSVDSLTGLVTTETGTINADSFILGNNSEALYDNYGQQDYLEISDFDLYQDTIQLQGSADDYYLGSSPSGDSDQGIFLKVAGMEDELVGVVKETTGLDINGNSFVFV